MYSAWKTAWATGLGLFVAGVIYTILSAGLLSGSVDDAGKGKAVELTLVAFAAFGAVVTLAVRAGLHLAGSRRLSRRSAMSIPLVYLVVAGLASIISIPTHAELETAAGSTTFAGMRVVVAVALGIGIVLLPMGISFIVGLRARTRLST